MNKNILSLFFVAGLLLTACTSNTQPEEVSEKVTDEISETENVDIELENLAEDYLQEELGAIIENDEGVRTVVKALYDLDDTQQSGPFRIKIRNVRLSQFKPRNDKIVMYGGYDLGLVSIHLLVENISNDQAMIFPMQGVIETDTGKKVDAHFSLSDQIGGEFNARSAKEGVVYCFFDGDAADVSQVTYRIEAPDDDEVQPLGDDFEFSFSFD